MNFEKKITALKSLTRKWWRHLSATFRAHRRINHRHCNCYILSGRSQYLILYPYLHTLLEDSLRSPYGLNLCFNFEHQQWRRKQEADKPAVRTAHLVEYIMIWSGILPWTLWIACIISDSHMSIKGSFKSLSIAFFVEITSSKLYEW